MCQATSESHETSYERWEIRAGATRTAIWLNCYSRFSGRMCARKRPVEELLLQPDASRIGARFHYQEINQWRR